MHSGPAFVCTRATVPPLVSHSTSAFNGRTCGQSARPRPITSVETKAEEGHSRRSLDFNSSYTLSYMLIVCGIYSVTSRGGDVTVTP